MIWSDVGEHAAASSATYFAMVGSSSYDAVHEADPARLVRVDDARREQEVERVRRPDEPRQQPRRAPLRDQAALREREREHGAIRGEAQVAAQRDRHGHSRDRSVDRSDDRFAPRQEVGVGPRSRHRHRIARSAASSGGARSRCPSRSIAGASCRRREAAPSPVITIATAAGSARPARSRASPRRPCGRSGVGAAGRHSVIVAIGSFTS